MKKRLLAIMNENGKYLAEFEANGGRVLAYTTNWHEAFEHALKVDWDAIKDDEENTKRLKFWADSVEGKLVVIEMDYQVTELESGEPREEYSESEGIGISNLIKELIEDLEGAFGGSGIFDVDDLDNSDGEFEEEVSAYD